MGDSVIAAYELDEKRLAEVFGFLAEEIEKTIYGNHIRLSLYGISESKSECRLEIHFYGSVDIESKNKLFSLVEE
jgi:hypothetical protein